MSPVAAINDHQEPPQRRARPYHGRHLSGGSCLFIRPDHVGRARPGDAIVRMGRHDEGSSVTSGETMTSHHPFGYSGPQWKAASGCNNGTCVEVAELPQGGVGIRDNKDGNSPVLEFSLDEFRTFVRGVKAGEFDI
ncbi:DUF397 domain-containing protein [Sphaerisporangium sp. NPDC088356]|uniref:DUF397 domain-containing protein n=1 Tax=Sphaerisporangium sp. NPDC088356 TaxID=3154871 RepID=UPI00343114C1